MKYLLSLLVAMLAGCGCASVPTHEDLRATTLRLEFVRGYCSGTAVAPDVLLTAAHCMQVGGGLVSVNGHPVTVQAVGGDSRDMAAVRISGVTFDHIARLGPPLVQGDRVRWWGNPNGQTDMYREGYVSRAWSDGVLIVAAICKGDSGAGLFNDAGQVVGVVSAMSDGNGCTFTLSFPRDV